MSDDQWQYWHEPERAFVIHAGGIRLEGHITEENGEPVKDKEAAVKLLQRLCTHER